MKIIFFGTPGFALPSLENLLNEGYEITAVITAPDKPQGRGRRVAPSAVKKYCLERGLHVLQPFSLNDKAFHSQLKELLPDLMVVVAYRILPLEVFGIPKAGAFNLHASMLPRYRGPAPINWVLINGETETGVTTFFLNERVDTGEIILQERTGIGENETAGELYERLATMGADTVLKTVRLIESGNVSTVGQEESKASSAPKITRELCRLKWTKPACDVHNLVRGLSPSPAAFTLIDGTAFKIYRTTVLDKEREEKPGMIIRADDELHVAAGKGIIRILELQREGKKRLSAGEFLAGAKITVGSCFSNTGSD